MEKASSELFRSLPSADMKIVIAKNRRGFEEARGLLDALGWGHNVSVFLSRLAFAACVPDNFDACVYTGTKLGRILRSASHF